MGSPSELQVGARRIDLTPPVLELPVPWHLEGALALQSGLGCAGMIGMILAWLVVGEFVESRKMWWFSLACMFAGAGAAKVGRDEVLLDDDQVRYRAWYGPWVLRDQALAARADLEAVGVISSQMPTGAYRLVLQLSGGRWVPVLPELFDPNAAAAAGEALAARLTVTAAGGVELQPDHDLTLPWRRRHDRVRTLNRGLTALALGAALWLGGPAWVSGVVVPLVWLGAGLVLARVTPLPKEGGQGAALAASRQGGGR